jgi:hypothetical protein
MPGVLPPQVAPGQPTQFFMDQRKQFLEGGAIAPTSGLQEPRDFGREGRGGTRRGTATVKGPRRRCQARIRHAQIPARDTNFARQSGVALRAHPNPVS